MADVNNNQFQTDARPTGFPGFTQSTLNSDYRPISQPAPNNIVETRKLKGQRQQVKDILNSEPVNDLVDNATALGQISIEQDVSRAFTGNVNPIRQTPIDNQYTDPFKQTVQENQTTLGSFENVYDLLPQYRPIIN